jgi:hypothetical protein
VLFVQRPENANTFLGAAKPNTAGVFRLVSSVCKAAITNGWPGADDRLAQQL